MNASASRDLIHSRLKSVSRSASSSMRISPKVRRCSAYPGNRLYSSFDSVEHRVQFLRVHPPHFRGAISSFSSSRKSHGLVMPHQSPLPAQQCRLPGHNRSAPRASFLLVTSPKSDRIATAAQPRSHPARQADIQQHDIRTPLLRHFQAVRAGVRACTLYPLFRSVPASIITRSMLSSTTSTRKPSKLCGASTGVGGGTSGRALPGSLTTNSLPVSNPSGGLWTSMTPPCSSTIRCAKLRPMPRPPAAR